MRIFFPLIFATLLILFFGLLEVLLLRLLNRAWWDRKYLRVAAWSLPLFGVIAVLVWGLGEYYTRDWLALPGAVLVALTLVLEVCLMLSLPLSGVIHSIHWIADRLSRKRKEKQPAYVDPNRRALLKTAAAALPAVTLLTGATGMAQAMGRVNVHKKIVYFDDLPSDLNGLRILHLSDLHLRHYVTLDDLTDVLSRAERFSPSLTLVTGDVADDLRLLPEALRLIAQVNSPFGAYACLGNHEYFRGIGEILRIFGRSSVTLLVERAVRINTGLTDLLIGGLDDPRSLGSIGKRFFETTIERTLTDKRDHDFVLLMSHRPQAVDSASEKEVPLTLAGHTHGGQIGFMGQSLFESVEPHRYWWGHYQLGRSHLYTSSGVGHWFPFRLGCPAEAPIIELRKR